MGATEVANHSIYLPTPQKSTKTRETNKIISFIFPQESTKQEKLTKSFPLSSHKLQKKTRKTNKIILFIFPRKKSTKKQETQTKLFYFSSHAKKANNKQDLEANNKNLQHRHHQYLFIVFHKRPQ